MTETCENSPLAGEPDEDVRLDLLDDVLETQALPLVLLGGKVGEVVEQVLHLLQVLPRLKKMYNLNIRWRIPGIVYEISACHFIRALLTFVMSPSASQM